MLHNNRTRIHRDVEELVGQDVADARAEYRRKKHDDGDAGGEVAGRIALQLVVTTPVRTHKQNASHGA